MVVLPCVKPPYSVDLPETHRNSETRHDTRQLLGECGRNGPRRRIHDFPMSVCSVRQCRTGAASVSPAGLVSWAFPARASLCTTSDEPVNRFLELFWIAFCVYFWAG